MHPALFLIVLHQSAEIETEPDRPAVSGGAQRGRRRVTRHTFVREEQAAPVVVPDLEAVPDYTEELLFLLAA